MQRMQHVVYRASTYVPVPPRQAIGTRTVVSTRNKKNIRRGTIRRHTARERLMPRLVQASEVVGTFSGRFLDRIAHLPLVLHITLSVYMSCSGSAIWCHFGPQMLTCQDEWQYMTKNTQTP